MCSIILRIGGAKVWIAANRDEMLARPWDSPGAYWPELPGVVAGRDRLAGGTWLGMNAHGVMAAVLNREGTLGPAAGKRSRGELPLLALAECSAAAAAAKLAVIDAGLYRSFNLVIADADGAFLLRGLETGTPDSRALAPGTWMITAGEPNDVSRPRIARHLPKFASADFAEWMSLIADDQPPADSALNIANSGDGFGTVCSSLITLSATAGPNWQFAAGPPDAVTFTPVVLKYREIAIRGK